MLSQGGTREIAELYDLTHSYATTAQLAGVDPKTVRRALARRAAGYPPETREHATLVAAQWDFLMAIDTPRCKAAGSDGRTLKFFPESAEDSARAATTPEGRCVSSKAVRGGWSPRLLA